MHEKYSIVNHALLLFVQWIQSCPIIKFIMYISAMGALEKCHQYSFLVQWRHHCSCKLLCAICIGFSHIYGTYISCCHWRPSWKGPPHFPHHLQATVHLPGCCICLPIIALRACTWYNRAHSTCEEKQVQKTYNDALLWADSHNWAVRETLLFRLVLAFLLWCMASDSSSYIWVVDPWFNESDGESQSQNHSFQK